MWDQELVIKAWNFSSSVHKKQLMPGSDIPYLNHLGLVTMEVMSAVASHETEQANLSVLCAILHDTIEDTQTCYQDIKHQFGITVADGVAALTKNTELATKSEQMLDSLSRLKKQPKAVQLVKLADRICNLQAPPKHWSIDKMQRYKNEASMIYEHLASSNSQLAARLANKIANYSLFFPYTKISLMDEYEVDMLKHLQQFVARLKSHESTSLKSLKYFANTLEINHHFLSSEFKTELYQTLTVNTEGARLGVYHEDINYDATVSTEDFPLTEVTLPFQQNRIIDFQFMLSQTDDAIVGVYLTLAELQNKQLTGAQKHLCFYHTPQQRLHITEEKPDPQYLQRVDDFIKQIELIN